MRSLRLLSNRARGRLVFCFCSFVSSSLFFYAGTKKNVSPSFFSFAKKKQNKKGRAPLAGPRRRQKRERKYVRHKGGALSFLRQSLEANLFVFEKKKEKKKTTKSRLRTKNVLLLQKKRERKRENLSKERRVNKSTNPKKVQNLQIARARKDART